MMINKLYTIIEDRKKNPKKDSYTVELLKMGEDKILRKIGEESIEVILAAKSEGDDRLVEEYVDLIYHLLVLILYKNLSLENINEEIYKRIQSKR